MGRTWSFDWKIVLFAVLCCYVVPWAVLGSISSLIGRPEFDGGSVRVEGPLLWWGAFSTLLYLLGFPFFAGFFTAKYASNRPQLHVLVVLLLGLLLAALVRPGRDPLSIVVHASIWLAIAALGAFIVLRKRT
jgi:hypothetical protein